ncbi:MAG: LAGLIDADG family homing endonuclease [Chloroflexi bacterium]|nr:LAGLIDADG family homing endonuclease [Chloroflexota bacterium]
MEQAEIGWVAGILDGEGYIGLASAGKYQARPRIDLVNNDESILIRYQNDLKDIGIASRIHHTERVFRVILSGKNDIACLLSIVGRYLTGWKIDRARLVLECCKLDGKSPGRLKRKEILSEYNRKYRRNSLTNNPE